MKKLIGIIIIGVFVLSCTSPEEKQKKQQQLKIEKIKAQVDSIRKERPAVPDEVYPLTTAYWQYFEDYPTDTLSPYYLHRAADESLYIQQGYKAITYLKRIEADFKDYRNLAGVIFSIGFIYDSHLQDYEFARSYYQLFVSQYPEHPLANDTKIMIQNLGKPLEDIIKEFEAKNANQ